MAITPKFAQRQRASASVDFDVGLSVICRDVQLLGAFVKLAVSKTHPSKCAAVGLAAAAGAALILPLSAREAQAQSSATSKLPSQLKPGECISKEAMLAGLDMERQFILITGEVTKLSAIDGSKVMAREAFTSDQHLSHGYQIGNNASGDYCKTADIFGIKLFDPRLPSSDPRAFSRSEQKEERGTLNGALRSVLKNAQEVAAMQFEVRANDSIGEILIGTVTVAPSGSGGLMISTQSGKLASNFGYGMRNVRLSDTALATLNK